MAIQIAEFKDPGIWQWEVPEGVDRVYVEGIGGGGGGGGGGGNIGGGGGGGASAIRGGRLIKLSPEKKTIEIVVGAGGNGGPLTGGRDALGGKPGESTSFDGQVISLGAAPGQAGAAGVRSNTGLGQNNIKGDPGEGGRHDCHGFPIPSGGSGSTNHEGANGYNGEDGQSSLSVWPRFNGGHGGVYVGRQNVAGGGGGGASCYGVGGDGGCPPTGSPDADYYPEQHACGAGGGGGYGSNPRGAAGASGAPGFLRIIY